MDMDVLSNVESDSAVKQTQKRAPHQEPTLADHDRDAPSQGDANSMLKHTKRFKRCLELTESEFSAGGGAFKGHLTRLQHQHQIGEVLSPITEISNHLSEANLGKEYVDETTPVKGFLTRRSKNHRGRVLNTEETFAADPATVDEISMNINASSEEQHLNKEINCECYQLARSSNHVLNPSRTAEMSVASAAAAAGAGTATSTLNEMSVDELSFYDDDTILPHDQLPFVASPKLIGLLAAEGSPQRFQIVAKPNSSNKFLQPLARNQKVQNVRASSTTASSNSPAKSFRMFHSLSSSSMESSIDDEYMELFEMESLESQHSSGLKFPSDLNSLISGQIKSSSPANRMPLSRTPRRPSVRRCLSMTENQQQQHFHQQQHQYEQNQQPKTPELLQKPKLETANANNGKSTATTPFLSRHTVERSLSTPLSSNSCFKRPESPSMACSPAHIKRYRGYEKENHSGSFTTTTSTLTLNSCSTTTSSSARIATSTLKSQSNSCPMLRKCLPMDEAEIMSALARSESSDDLIGDFSKPFVLPLMEGRHRDLKSISSNTVARLINGEFCDEVASYKIIDCRYPYEYEGGHIRGAVNLYTQEQIVDEFIKHLKTDQQKEQQQPNTAGNKRNIIIFHCEFSSERGPKLSRFLRNNDRARNTNAYPSLDYPEIYLLHNGYKEFYETHAELCDPVSYRPMLEPSYSEAYRHFRAKSKSWNGDGLGGGTTRLKKSRSRLML